VVAQAAAEAVAKSQHNNNVRQTNSILMSQSYGTKEIWYNYGLSHAK